MLNSGGGMIKKMNPGLGPGVVSDAYASHAVPLSRRQGSNAKVPMPVPGVSPRRLALSPDKNGSTVPTLKCLGQAVRAGRSHRIHVAAFDDHVDNAVLQQVLGVLETFEKYLLHPIAFGCSEHD